MNINKKNESAVNTQCLKTRGVIPNINTGLTPPVAKKIPIERKFHGDVFVDNYEWLRQKDSEKVIEHLNKENEYTKNALSHLEPLEKELYEEMKGHINETDVSLAARSDGSWYFVRTQ
jgi:oligopeptidase B